MDDYCWRVFEFLKDVQVGVLDASWSFNVVVVAATGEARSGRTRAKIVVSICQIELSMQ